MKRLVPAILLVLVSFMGCLDLQPVPGGNANITPSSTPSGCSFDDPPCGQDQACINNTCIQSSVLSDLENHTSVFDSDSDELASLSSQGQAIIRNYNVDLSVFKETYMVSPKEDAYVNFHMKKSYVLEGNVSVRGGSDFDIDLSLQGSNGTMYIPKTRISTRYQLSFTAPKDDKYMLILGNMFTSFDTKTVKFDMKDNKYHYYQQYLSWSKNYSDKAEPIAQHLKRFEDFLSKNENDLNDAGVDTVGLEDSISDSRIGLIRSVTGVNESIQNMTDYFSSIGELQQQEQQQSAETVSRINRIMAILG